MTKNELITRLKVKGFKINENPPTVYVPVGTEEENIPIEMVQLRNDYKYMIQTEIT